MDIVIAVNDLLKIRPLPWSMASLEARKKSLLIERKDQLAKEQAAKLLCLRYGYSEPPTMGYSMHKDELGITDAIIEIHEFVNNDKNTALSLIMKQEVLEKIKTL